VGQPDHRPERVVKTVRRGLVGTGALLMAYAIGGALTDRDVRIGALVFLIGVLVAHDGILSPITIGAGVVLGRLVPPRGRAYVQGALIAGLAVTIVAFPLVLGRGRAADNPSLLPLDYGRGLLEVYAVIVVVAAGLAGSRAWVRHRGRKRLERSADPDDE
jgi:hypothetical protein